MSRQPVVIYSAANAPQAYLLKGLLEDEGIAALVVNDSIQAAGGELPLGWTSAPRVVVQEEDSEAARALAEEFDAGLLGLVDASDSADGEVFDQAADWPKCPTCGERRAARCTVCGMSGADFPVAEYQPQLDSPQMLLFCAACDDHFSPEWYRLCARCGHDYGEGVMPVQSAAAEPFPRVMQLLAAMFLAAGLFAVYFIWLFRGGNR